jgi:hypothetical protein
MAFLHACFIVSHLIVLHTMLVVFAFYAMPSSYSYSKRSRQRDTTSSSKSLNGSDILL